jgi:hypothetical protein
VVDFKYLNQTYMSCCYHPPAPYYKPNDFVAELTSDNDEIMQRNDVSPIIIVSGDFNSLNTDLLEVYYGLSLIVHDITHGKRI